MKEESNFTIALDMALQYSRDADSASMTDAYDTERQNRIRAKALVELLAKAVENARELDRADVEAVLESLRVEAKFSAGERYREAKSLRIYALEQLLARMEILEKGGGT